MYRSRNRTISPPDRVLGADLALVEARLVDALQSLIAAIAIPANALR